MKDSARLPKERIDMGRLEQLILGHSQRGMDMLADLLPADFCVDAGRLDRKSTRLNSSHTDSSRMPSSA